MKGHSSVPAPDVEDDNHFADLPPFRADRWLETASAHLALGRLDDLLTYLSRDRMPCLLVYRFAGIGKTKIIRKFLRDLAPTFYRGTRTTTMRMVAMQMPGEPVEREVYGELLNAMSAPGPMGNATFRLKATCRNQMRSMSVRMLIIDEIHAMLTGTYQQQPIFLNVISFLASDLKVPLICAGTDLARQALLTDPQLAERFETFHQKRWVNDQHLAQLLASLGPILPLRRPSDLGSASVRRRILELTDGVTVRIFGMIETAAAEAVRHGREAMTLESFDGEDLVLPLVAMTQHAEGQLRRQVVR